MNRNENDKRTFFYMVSLLIIVVVTIVLITLQGCAEPEYPVLEIEPDIISYSNNLIKLQSDDIVILDNGIGHFDKWKIKEGVTFELIVNEVDDYVRFYDTPDFTVSSDRIYTVGQGRDHVTDFTALNPPNYPYYFSMDVIINGTKNTVDYMIILVNP